MSAWFEHSYGEEGDSPERVRARVERLVEELGLDRFAFAVRTPLRDGSAGGGFEAVTNYPEEWRARYLGHRYDLVDPVVEVASGTSRPFFWGGGRFLRGFGKRQRLVFEEARAFGLVAGLAIPVHGATAQTGLFTVAADDPGRLRDAVRGEHERLFAAAFALHDAMQNRLPGAAPDAVLSPRERECLLWTAEGKTAEEVAALLGLSVFTVNRHVSNAARKLDCTNKHHAVVRALRAGLI